MRCDFFLSAHSKDLQLQNAAFRSQNAAALDRSTRKKRELY